MPVVLGCGLGAAVLAPAIPAAAVALSWLAGVAAAWIALSARLISSLPYAQTSSRTVVVSLAGSLLAVAVLRALPGYRRRQVVAAVAALVPLLAVGWWAVHPPTAWSPPTGLRASFLDVGQGDGILLETPQGAVLVDAGPPEARVDRQVRRMGLRALAALVVTHAHRDHVGGAPAVLRSLSVGGVIDPMQPGAGYDERLMRRTARQLGVPLVPARVGKAYALGRLHLRVLWPDHAGSPDEDPHLHGVVLLVTYGSIDLLLTGDSESTVTRALPLRQVEVLKVAHHGSSDSGLSEEIRVLRPRVAVISVGARNDYGHPRADTLAALAGMPGLAVYRTDENGRIVLESDGRSLTIRKERGVP
jgi:competence protein ComEC